MRTWINLATELAFVIAGCLAVALAAVLAWHLHVGTIRDAVRHDVGVDPRPDWVPAEIAAQRTRARNQRPAD